MNCLDVYSAGDLERMRDNLADLQESCAAMARNSEAKAQPKINAAAWRRQGDACQVMVMVLNELLGA